jgi:hypothetical protein|nr:MAG TPA: hypothetical protein [Caudoviricetes sp.]
MIDDELFPIVTEFVMEMLNDPHCKSVLLDVGEDARAGSDLSVLYLDVVGKRCGCTLSILGGEYSATIRNSVTNNTITIVERGKEVWELLELLDGIKTKLREDK